MFIVTTKFSKKKALIIVLAIAVVIAAIIILAGRQDQRTDPNAPNTRVENSADILTYLDTLGWQVASEPLEVQEVVIPREFDQIFKTYNALQREAGFDLEDYKGVPVVRHTWQVLNHPEQADGVVADVLVADGRIIGGDVHSTHIDGFMHGLFPHPGV